MPVVTLQSYDCIITEKYGPDLGQSHRVSLEEAENDRKFMQWINEQNDINFLATKSFYK